MLTALCLLAWQQPIRPVNTYSIVAFDAERGELGVAVQSHWFSVGTAVPWVQSGVGAVATQSLVDISYGPLGLAMMQAGRTPEQALAGIKLSDPQFELRQVAMVDVLGNVAAHTGSRCIAEAGHHTGASFSVQANIMEKNTVWAAMARAFEATRGDLAERMLAALEAAQAEGGDLRGMQSAALVVVKAQSTGVPWRDRIYDIRIDDHPQPLKELRRVLGVARAYRLMDQGDEHIAHNDMDAAMGAYSKAMALMPDQAEIAFWAGITMATTGQFEESLPILAKAYALDPKLRQLVPRLIDSGLLGELAKDPVALKRLQSAQ